MKTRLLLAGLALHASCAFSATTISSLEDFIALQDQSNLDIKMTAGTYHISDTSKSLFTGSDWRANVLNDAGESDIWPGLLLFSGSNNTFDLTGVTFTIDSTIFSDLPNVAHGVLIELSGENNTWKGLNVEEVAGTDGTYGSYTNISGGTFLEVNGSGHDFSDLTVKPKYSRPYGFGSIYGKTGSSSGMLPNSRLGKKSGLYLNDLEDSTFTDVLVDQSSFGHTLFFNGPIDNVVFDGVTVIAESRSTDALRDNGIAGADRNGVPFGVYYDSNELVGSSDDGDFEDYFDTSNLDQCQNLDSDSQSSPISTGYQFTLTEAAFRGYTMDQIETIEMRNVHVIGGRSGIALTTAAGAVYVENMTATGIAGHGVPACGGWNGDNGGEGDATAFGVPSNSVLVNAAADAAYSTVLEISDGQSNITADIQVLDPENGYFRPSASTALALISGDGHAIRLWRDDGSALEEDLVIKVGNSSTDDLFLCNMTKQAVTLSSSVTNSIIYSVGSVTDNSNGTNEVYSLDSANDEPEACELIKTGYSRNNSNVGERELQWGDKVFVGVNTYNNYSSNCGWFGCRVGYMDDDKALQLSHGLDTPQSFYLRQDPAESYAQSCVVWGDKVTLAYSSQGYQTSDCGWYGCRVAKLNDDQDGITFGHGLTAPTSFYVRPPADESASGCVTSTDELVLAYSSSSGDTSDCGWYGCRVLQYDDSSALVVKHGNDDPTPFYLRSWEQVFDAYEYEEPYERDSRSWTVESGKLVYSTGACFTYSGGGVFQLLDCDQVSGNWSINSDNRLQWATNPWGLDNGACYGYQYDGEWGFDSCDDVNTAFYSNTGQFKDDTNADGLSGGACFDYLGGGEFGYIACDDF